MHRYLLTVVPRERREREKAIGTYEPGSYTSETIYFMEPLKVKLLVYERRVM